MEIKPIYLDVRDIENLKEICCDRDDMEIKLTGYMHYKATGKTLYGLTFIEYFPYSEEGAKKKCPIIHKSNSLLIGKSY